MKTDKDKLNETLESNPQVDAEFVIRALEKSREILGESDSMVKFNIQLPYATDNYGLVLRKL